MIANETVKSQTKYIAVVGSLIKGRFETTEKPADGCVPVTDDQWDQITQDECGNWSHDYFDGELVERDNSADVKEKRLEKACLSLARKEGRKHIPRAKVQEWYFCFRALQGGETI